MVRFFCVTVWRYYVFARKLTLYSVYIINTIFTTSPLGVNSLAPETKYLVDKRKSVAASYLLQNNLKISVSNFGSTSASNCNVRLIECIIRLVEIFLYFCHHDKLIAFLKQIKSHFLAFSADVFFCRPLSTLKKSNLT